MSPRKKHVWEDWGYCLHCNRLEPIDGEGNITAHLDVAEYMNSRKMCAGSLEAPTEQPGPDVAAFAAPDWKTAKNIVIPPNRRRPRDPDYPVCDPFGHPLHEVAERLKAESEQLRKKLERARRIHNGERG